MTDGLENASREFTHATAKALLDVCRAKNWQVIFLGADFDNAAQAASYGNVASATIAASAANLPEAMTEAARMRASYADIGAPMHYTDEQKRRLRQ
jgi:hypothetical protein